MARFLKRLLFAVVLAALTAFGVVLWTSPDPTYRLQSWMAGSRYHTYDDLITDLAHKHGVDPLLIKAIAWRESAFQTEKIGTSGERGLMQVSEAAARDWAKAMKIETFAPTDLFDPKTNVDAGSSVAQEKRSIAGRTKRTRSRFALAEYNAGHVRVERWIAGFRPRRRTPHLHGPAARHRFSEHAQIHRRHHRAVPLLPAAPIVLAGDFLFFDFSGGGRTLSPAPTNPGISPVKIRWSYFLA